MQNENSSKQPLSRRQLLRGAAGATAAGALAMASSSQAVQAKDNAKKKLKGNINHSIVSWCFADHWSPEETVKQAVNLGCKSVELIDQKHWPLLKKNNLVCALSGSHLFAQGVNNPKYQAQCIEMMRDSIDACADAGFPTVITFTGFAAETGDWADGGIPDMTKLPKNPRVIDPDEGIKNCVAAYKKIVGYAEKKKINLSLEMLNSRVSNHPMKGHPGYQGDHVDYCMEIINQVGSPRLGLLFDVYHVQIMDGDIITRIHECGDAITHVHTAGNPGRGELDIKQEVNYEPVMKALTEIGFKGYVGHEFIPTRNPAKGLAEAIAVCDV